MSSHYYTIFKRQTGEIAHTGFFACADDLVDINFALRLDTAGAADHDVMDGAADPAIHYIVMIGETPVAVERPPIPYQIDSTTVAAGDGSYVTITGLHNPCELVIDDPDPTVETWRVTVEDGGFEFEADTPGVYTIEISRFPFLPARIEITAT